MWCSGKKALSVRDGWVDACKGMAILAVVLDHSAGLLYQDTRICLFSFYSVSLFILIAGVNFYRSLQRKEIRVYDFSFVVRGCKKILLPYIMAIVIREIIQTGALDFVNVFYTCVSFPGEFYYVFLYMMMLVAAPFVYLLVEVANRGKRPLIRRGFLLLVCYAFCIFTTNHSRMLPFSYGGATVVFGGSYLFLLLVGMLFAVFLKNEKTKIRFTKTQQGGGSFINYSNVLSIYLQ